MATDTFDGSGTLTSPWTVIAGSFNQTGGIVYGNSNSISSFAVNTSTGVLGDQECTVTMTPRGSGQFIGPAVRCSSSAHTGAAVDCSSDGLYINTWSAGTATTLPGMPITAPAAGTAIKLRATGSNTLRLYYNGVEQTGLGSPFTATFPATGYCGLSAYSNGTGTGATDWTGEALNTQLQTPRSMQQYRQRRR
jgi:hypothetical protein